jgi:DNA-binding CsgD family transcriptional regulator
MTERLLERSEELRVLASALRAADQGRGLVAVVSGEAGVGKTSLVQAFQSSVPANARVLTGYCDALSTPRVLGPMKDLAPSLGPEFRTAVQAGDRDLVMSALLTALGDGPTTVVVVEDLHWADEGTLDVLRYVARRLASVHVLLLVTCRDDEATPRGLSALVAAASATSTALRLSPLSPEAVRILCMGHRVDTDDVFSLTTGNPYLVTEILASRTTTAPLSVVGAVADRLARLPDDTRALVERLAVVPGSVEPRLASALIDGAWEALAPAERSGLLSVVNAEVTFRHELTRMAVLEGVPGARQTVLHRRTLDALLKFGDADPGRLVHHAVACGDVDTVIDEGPRAAREAAASGSHREAIAHYRTVLEHEALFRVQDRADLWEALGIQLYLSGDASGVTAAERAVELRRVDPDEERLVRSLCWLSRLAWVAGQPGLALQSADEAVSRATRTAHPGTQALALANRSQIAMLYGEYPTAIELGGQAVAYAAEADDDLTMAEALNNVGTSLMVTTEGGEPELRRSIGLALSVGDAETACRGYCNLAWVLVARHEMVAADAAVAEGLALAVEAEHEMYETHLTAIRSRIAMADCDWRRAAELAAAVPEAAHASRGITLVVEALLAARTASPGHVEKLQEAWGVAERADELQRRGPVAAAALEAAFLAGTVPPVIRAVSVYREAERLGDRRLQAELAYRLRAAGHPRPDDELVDLQRQTDSPFAVQAAGRWHEAAEGWRALGRPYEEAQALAEANDETTRLRALGMLDQLGAVGLSRRVRRQLRDEGATGVPRGPVTRTRGNPSGLTDRQLAVLALVAEGLTNAEIADRLVLSRRTVDTHVAAVLAKLGVTSRRGASEAFRALADAAPDLGTAPA